LEGSEAEPLPKYEGPEALILHTNSVELAILQELFLLILEIENSKPDDRHGSEYDVVHLINERVVKGLAREC
jgi:hypothetical protein